MGLVNYILAATLVDTNASFEFPMPGTEFDYDTILWLTTPISKAILKTAYLAAEKARQIQLISSAMQIEVTSGFLSDVVTAGVFRRYDSDIQGQVGVVGAMVYLSPFPGITPPTTFTLSSVDPSTGAREYNALNYAQLYELLGDLGTFSSALITKLTTKITAIYMINTGDVFDDLDAVYAITWESVE